MVRARPSVNLPALPGGLTQAQMRDIRGRPTLTIPSDFIGEIDLERRDMTGDEGRAGFRRLVEATREIVALGLGEVHVVGYSYSGAVGLQLAVGDDPGRERAEDRLDLARAIAEAEDMVVLDIISGGRVSYVIGLGYRPDEIYTVSPL